MGLSTARFFFPFKTMVPLLQVFCDPNFQLVQRALALSALAWDVVQKHLLKEAMGHKEGSPKQGTGPMVWGRFFPSTRLMSQKKMV